MTNDITLVEVGPRDGLQNESVFIPTDLKLQFIRALAESGLSTIEATSCVSPRWVPQMRDHVRILESLDFNGPVRYPVLIPNTQGLKTALEHNVKDIAVFLSASERFSQHNTNCSIDESIQRIQSITDYLQQNSAPNTISIRAYVSCVLGCPYDEDIRISTVKKLSKRLRALGISQIALGDTIGTGTPETTDKLLSALVETIEPKHLAVHFHDTHGHALSNIGVALHHQIYTIDCSAGGLGGCPYAPGASGNVATEKVIDYLGSKGYELNINKERIAQAYELIQQYIQNHSEQT